MADRDGLVASGRHALDSGRCDCSSRRGIQPYRNANPRVGGRDHGLRIPLRTRGPQRAVPRRLESTTTPIAAACFALALAMAAGHFAAKATLVDKVGTASDLRSLSSSEDKTEAAPRPVVMRSGSLA